MNIKENETSEMIFILLKISNECLNVMVNVYGVKVFFDKEFN